MSLRAISAFILSVACLATVSLVSAENLRHQLRYEPEVARVSGTLIGRTFAGPPNFDDIKSGDIPETPWILLLSKPIDVLASVDDELNISESDVREIQLVFMSDSVVRTLLSKGRHVEVTGRLFSAITGHHHTRVLIEVFEVSKSRGTTRRSN